jgi:hypothetical protein
MVDKIIGRLGNKNITVRGIPKTDFAQSALAQLERLIIDAHIGIDCRESALYAHQHNLNQSNEWTLEGVEHNDALVLISINAGLRQILSYCEK